MDRKLTREIHVGTVTVGGGAPVSVQSMTNTKTADVYSTTEQIAHLRDAGCDIVRLAVPDMESAQALAQIVPRAGMPVVADIHFDYRLALEAARAGVAKIRINPGNIGGRDNVAAVAACCAERGIPIRIGVNSGSIEKEILAKYGHPTAEGMVESAERHVRLLTDCGFEDICLSLKASNVPLTVEAYRLASKRLPYPLHLGVTEAGTSYMGTIQSAVGIGTLLMEGIGDTIRVSLTADPIEEVAAGIAILKSAGLRNGGVRFISCPTCGRTEIDLISTANRVQELLRGCKRDITVAVMGCVVNGPGEAREADYGLAGGKDCGVLFRKGKIVGKVPGDHLAEALAELIGSEKETNE